LLGAKEKLLLKVTDRDVPNLKHCWDRNSKIIPPHGIVNSYQYLGIYYNPSKISRPESWENYWDPGKHYGEKIKGRVLTWDPGGLKSIYALIMAAKLGGGGVHNMAPAWEYLKKQKPYVGPVLRGSSAAVPYFENGELWLAAYWSARGALYQARGVPMQLVIPKEGTFSEADCAAIPIGTKNKKLAYEFLNFRLDKDVQRNFCLAYKIGPGRKDITDWPKEFAGQQITTKTDLDKAIFPDLEVIGAKRKEWTIKWQGIMGA
jgi:putative spermidine/putrescine transport system substrate-binding protein